MLSSPGGSKRDKGKKLVRKLNPSGGKGPRLSSPDGEKGKPLTVERESTEVRTQGRKGGPSNIQGLSTEKGGGRLGKKKGDVSNCA